MAQKSKAQARTPSKSKSSVVAKKAKTASKPAPAKKTVGVLKVKVAAKPAKSVKPAKAVEAPPAAKKGPAKTMVATHAAKEIGQAKAALKKETSATATPKTKSRRIAIDASPTEALSALTQKWASLYKKAEQIEAKPYNMKAVFEEKTAITHKVLGWGYILANRNDRLEVLFKDGIKYLISNYKP